MNVVPVKDLTPDEAKVLTLDLRKNMDPEDVQNEKLRGQLVLEAIYKPFKGDEIPFDPDNSSEVQKAPEGTPAGGGLLVIIIHEGQSIEGKNHTNPSIRLLFRGEVKKTKVNYFHDAVHILIVLLPGKFFYLLVILYCYSSKKYCKQHVH